MTSMPEYTWLQRAREIGVESFWYKEGKKTASLAEYMGKGKHEPYADWIIAYVNNG